MIFSDKLHQLRKKAGMSQEDLAEKLDVSRQAISRWELGSAMPDTSNLIRIADLFGVSVDYLLQDNYCANKDSIVTKELTSKKQELNKKKRIQYSIASISMAISSCCFFISGALSGTYLYFVAGTLNIISAIAFLYTSINLKPTNEKERQ